MLKEKQKYILKCEEMNNFGNSVCRIDGMVVFVNGAVVGDTVEAQIEKITSSYAIANTTKIIFPSPSRIAPECVSFEKCGGCSFSHVHISKENEIKSNYVKSTLRKFGIEAEFDKIECPVSEKYRNKVVLFYEKGNFGYKERATNRVVPHNRCPLNEKLFDEIAQLTLKVLDCTYLRALYMRKSSNEKAAVMVCPIFRKATDIKHYAKRLRAEIPYVVSVMHGICTGRDMILEDCEFKCVSGDEYIEDRICGIQLQISPKSFYQINHACTEKLYERVLSYLDVTPESRVADLFCGTGTMGLMVAKRTGAHVYGVEIEPEAVRDAKRNAKLNGIHNIEFFEGDARDFDKSMDACIIDPPRKGCSELMIETLLRLNPKTVVYVSCNPDTLARDLKALLKKYDISSPISVFNMFPRTSHVESVVCLKRRLDNELRERMN